MKVEIIKREYDVEGKHIICYKVVLEVDYNGEHFKVEMKPYQLGLNKETYEAFIKEKYEKDR